MRCERDYSTDARFCADFGGVEPMKKLMDYAATLEAPACPHCGGDAITAFTSVYGRPAARILCCRCRCQTMLFTSGAGMHFTDNGSFEWIPVSIEDCLKNALERWARRVPCKGALTHHRKAAVKCATA